MNGEAQPPGYYKQSFLCEAFRILSTNYAMLTDTTERSTHWEKNIDSLSSRLQRFTEQFESRCTSAISSSRATIKQCSRYKLFDQEFDPSLLPSYFQSKYEQMKSQKNAILIDIGGESAIVKPEDDRYIVDRTRSVDLTIDDNSGEPPFSAEIAVATDEHEIVLKLPPPLCPQVIQSDTQQ